MRKTKHFFRVLAICILVNVQLMGQELNTSKFDQSLRDRLSAFVPQRYLIRSGESAPQKWFFKTSVPELNWIMDANNNQTWQTGDFPIGNTTIAGVKCRTKWSDGNLWVRRKYHQQGGRPNKIVLRIAHTGSARVLVNGVEIYKSEQSSNGYITVEPSNKETFRDLDNIVCVELGSSKKNFFDMGLIGFINPVPIEMPAIPTANDIVRHLHPIMDISIRDFAITKGHDGAYYVTGTGGYPDFWKGNDGSIPVYRSLDLKKWDFLGNVWSFIEAPDWLKEKVKGNMNKISLWAPEIHYIDGNYYIVYSTNAQFIGLLKSTTGKPQGPYKDFLNKQLTDRIDPSLFQDTDKKTYLIYKNMYIALMKSDMSDLAETPRILKTKEGGYIGFEGISMFKNGSTYFITCADNINEFGYSSIVGSADNPYGPYSSPYLAIPHGGHNNYIQSKDGKWYATMFGFDGNSPFYEQPGIVPMEVNQKGYFQPMGTKDETVMKQKQLIPNGKLGFPWSMKDKVQSEEWFKNDSTFQFAQNGYLAYGEDSASFAINTNGKLGDFYLRKSFEVSFDKISLLTLTYKFEGQASFYLNDLNVGENIKCSGKLQHFSLSGAVLNSLHKGQNVFSIQLKTDNTANIELGLQAWVNEIY
jgi:hypothetical protein